MKKEVESGDVFEIKTNKGYAYLQCVDMPGHNNEVELIKVFYDLHKEHLSIIDDVERSDFFYIRFPLKAAYRRKIVLKIFNASLSDDFEIPTHFRTENMFDEGWQIVDSKTLHRKSVTELTAEQKKMSPWGGINDTQIIELLEKGWRLENWTLENMFE
jgi:hypothetical protein